jgi:Spy/CpxP family protein refolding chaperone
MAQSAREYRGMGRMGQNLAGVNLTDEQKGKIKAIVARYEPEVQKLRTEQKNVTDKQTFRGQVQDLNRKMMQEIKAVLTPEQVQQMGQGQRPRKNAKP